MRKNILVATFCMLFLMNACQQSKEVNNTVLGKWKVQWITYPSEGAAPDPSLNLTMNGKMNIESNGKITVEAFGYDGCIFGTDTLVHSLKWSLSGDTLNLTNEGDEFGIPYIIKESSEKKIKLQLVDDVFLFLTKE